MPMPTEKYVGLIESQARMIRARHLNPVLKVRVHPLDLAYLGREQSPKGTSTARILRIAGLPVEPDCACGRMNPTVEIV